MKKLRKIMMSILVILIIPCLFLFTGCTLGTTVYENDGQYFRYYEEEDTPSEENWELIEGLEGGAIYQYIGSDAEIFNKLTIKNDNEAELEFSLSEYQDGAGTVVSLKYEASYEIYNGIYITYFQDINEEGILNIAYAEIIDNLLNMEESSVESLEEARTELDAYLASEQSFTEYFGSNMITYG